MKNQRGITLVTLVITIVLLIIITATIAINSHTSLELSNLTKLENDIQALNDRVAVYYVANGTLPVTNDTYMKTEISKSITNLSPNDGDTYYKIDLSKLSNITLNYKNNTYIINETSHKIYMIEGIKYEGETYYTTGKPEEEIISYKPKYTELLDGNNVRYNKITKFVEATNEIKYIKKATKEQYNLISDTLTSDNIVSTSESETETYMWYDNNDTLYYYADTNKIYMNQDSSLLFEILSEVVEIDLSAFDTSKVTNMSKMFAWDKKLTNLNVSNFDTSNVTDMNMMFTMIGATNIDVSNFDTSKVTNMSKIFQYDYNITTLNVTGWNTTNVTDMSSMFEGCKNLANLDVSNFNTSKVTNMSKMFQNTISNLELKNFDTSKVTNMAEMFRYSKADVIDVSEFKTSKVTDMSYMFEWVTKVKILDVSKWDTSNVTNMEGVFHGISSVEELALGGFDTKKVTNMKKMFESVHMKQIDVSSFDTSNVTNMDNMFNTCYSLKTIFANENFDTSNVSTSEAMFYNTKLLEGEKGTKTYQNDEPLNPMDKTYARVDTSDNPGYFTYKATNS